MDLLKLLDGEVGVEFGGVEVFVAEELLDGAEVGSVVHHEGGDGVAEEMAGAFLFDACGLNVFANEVAKDSWGERFSGVGEEEAFVVVGFDEELGSDVGEVFVEPFRGAISEGKEAVFFAFALADHEGLLLEVEVVEGEVGEFLAPDAGGVEGFQEGSISYADGGVDVGDVEDGFHFMRGEQ